ncbi:MAG TPA: hypothetical protein VFP97_17920 [Chitinophagaceae bacterium]|nr:hypothetical protein [Chitinophagaceae bacterium]
MTGNQFWDFMMGMSRAIMRIIVEIIHRLLINIFDTLFGFVKWPEKKLRIKVLLLKTPHPDPDILPHDINTAINYAKEVFRKNFNVKIIPVQNTESFAETLDSIPPYEVLHTKGGTGALTEEFKAAGNFFAAYLRAPIYPVTVYVVMSIKGATGCSLGPLTDYVTLDHGAARETSILAHELAHACGLWHLQDKENLLWNRKNRGDKTNWWQKNICRSSRHVTYW